METIKKLPLSFFEKSRPNAPRNSLKDIKPFSWSNEKEIFSGKKSKKIIIGLPKKADNR